MIMADKPLTGRKVLVIALSAFGVIIGANMALVYAAIGSFPGLEVKNTYVTSQSFEAERAAQLRLGWQLTTGFDGQNVTLEITDRHGQPVEVADIAASIGRATHANADVMLPFDQNQSPFTAPITLAKGKWELRLIATAGDGTRFRQRLPIWVE